MKNKILFVILLLILLTGCGADVENCQAAGHSLEVCLNTLAR